MGIGRYGRGHRSLAGVRIPGLGDRTAGACWIRDYSPAMLRRAARESGDVTWSGAGSISGSDGWTLRPADSAPMTFLEPAKIDFTDAHRSVLANLGFGGAYFSAIDPRRPDRGHQSRSVELIWAGRVTRHLFTGTRGTRRAGTRKRAAPAFLAGIDRRAEPIPPRAQARNADPTVAGRWSRRFPNRTPRCAPVQAELLLNRHGDQKTQLLPRVRAGSRRSTRCSSTGDAVAWLLHRVVGGAQFAVASTVDQLRSYLIVDPRPAGLPTRWCWPLPTRPTRGAALPWPASSAQGGTARPGPQKPALVVLVDGELAMVPRARRAVVC